MGDKIDELLDTFDSLWLEDAYRSEFHTAVEDYTNQVLAVRDKQIERLAVALRELMRYADVRHVQDDELAAVYKDAYEINRHFGFDIAGVKALKKMIETALRNEE